MEAGQHHVEDREDEEDADCPGGNACDDIAASGAESTRLCVRLPSLAGELAGGGSECAGHQDSSNRVDTVRSRNVAMAMEKITTTTP